MPESLARSWAETEIAEIKKDHPDWDEFEVTEAAIRKIDQTRQLARGAIVAAVLRFWHTYMISPELQRKYGFETIRDVLARMADEDNAGKLSGLASEITAIETRILPMLKDRLPSEEAEALVFDNTSKARAVAPLARMADIAGTETREEVAGYIASVLANDDVTVQQIKADVRQIRRKTNGDKVARKGIMYAPSGERIIVIVAPEGWNIPPSVNSADDDLTLSSPRALIDYIRATFPKETR